MQNSPVGSDSCIFLNNADSEGLSFSKTPANARKTYLPRSCKLIYSCFIYSYFLYVLIIYYIKISVFLKILQQIILSFLYKFQS